MHRVQPLIATAQKKMAENERRKRKAPAIILSGRLLAVVLEYATKNGVKVDSCACNQQPTKIRNALLPESHFVIDEITRALRWCRS
jgi:hypothetical protein